MSMNPLTIEQDPDEVKLAFSVHQNSVLRQIRLVRAKLASSVRPEVADDPLEIGFQHKSKHVDAPPNLFRVAVSFKMTGKRPGEDTAPVTVECDFEADYELLEGFTLNPEAARAFKDGNAVFNMWPYFREYLQSSIQRMGLPPLTAPFLRLQPKPRKPVEAPPSKAK